MHTQHIWNIHTDSQSFKVCYIFFCLYCLLSISLRKRRRGGYFSAIYLTLLQIWHISKTLLIHVAMCQKKIQKEIKNIPIEKWMFSLVQLPRLPRCVSKTVRKKQVAFSTGRKSHRMLEEVLFQSGWIKYFPKWLSTKQYHPMSRDRPHSSINIIVSNIFWALWEKNEVMLLLYTYTSSWFPWIPGQLSACMHYLSFSTSFDDN